MVVVTTVIAHLCGHGVDTDLIKVGLVDLPVTQVAVLPTVTKVTQFSL
jgi:hypothetical protein